MSEDIKACPFCGGDAELVWYGYYNFYNVRCNSCFATGPQSSQDEKENKDSAILLWNAAANALAKKDEEIETLKQWLKNTIDEAKKRNDEAVEIQHKLNTDLYMAKKRESSSDKRQDELEAEIEKLRESMEFFSENASNYLAERDEARRVARRLYKERDA